MTESEKLDYRQAEMQYELERMRRAEQDERKEFEDWAQAQQDYYQSLGA